MFLLYFHLVVPQSKHNLVVVNSTVCPISNHFRWTLHKMDVLNKSYMSLVTTRLTDK